LSAKIHAIHRGSRESYGVPRIHAELADDYDIHVGKKRVARLMRAAGLRGVSRRRFVRTTVVDRHADLPPDLVDRNFQIDQLDRLWVADITYLRTAVGTVYLAAILDLYSRRIVGWAVSQRIDTALVMAAWNMAIRHRQPPSGLIFHSDRGVQYASQEYRQALKTMRASASMSRKGNCYDNAVMEAFWSTLKLELIYRRQREFAGLAEAQAALFEYIEVFYNRQRLHSALAFQTPVGFELSRN